MFDSLFDHTRFAWIVSLMGGASVLITVLLIIFVPGMLVILSPIIVAIVETLKAIVKYLWTGFLYLSGSVPALLFVLFLMVCVHYYTEYKSALEYGRMIHRSYKLIQKTPKYKSYLYNKQLKAQAAQDAIDKDLMDDGIREQEKRDQAIRNKEAQDQIKRDRELEKADQQRRAKNSQQDDEQDIQISKPKKWYSPKKYTKPKPQEEKEDDTDDNYRPLIRFPRLPLLSP